MLKKELLNFYSFYLNAWEGIISMFNFWLLNKCLCLFNLMYNYGKNSFFSMFIIITVSFLLPISIYILSSKIFKFFHILIALHKDFIQRDVIVYTHFVYNIKRYFLVTTNILESKFWYCLVNFYFFADVLLYKFYSDFTTIFIACISVFSFIGIFNSIGDLLEKYDEDEVGRDKRMKKQKEIDDMIKKKLSIDEQILEVKIDEQILEVKIDEDLEKEKNEIEQDLKLDVKGDKQEEIEEYKKK